MEVSFYFLYSFIITEYVESKRPCNKAPHTCAIPETKGQYICLQRLRLNLQNQLHPMATLLYLSLTLPNGF